MALVKIAVTVTKADSGWGPSSKDRQVREILADATRVLAANAGQASGLKVETRPGRYAGENTQVLSFKLTEGSK